MSLSHYIGVAGNIDIKMAGSIAEDHTVNLDPNNTLNSLSDLTFNTSKTLTFTSGNWDTNQQVNIIPRRQGPIQIPYKVSSAYTRKVKEGFIVVETSEQPPSVVWSNLYMGANSVTLESPTVTNAIVAFKIGSITVDSTHPKWGQTLLIRKAAAQANSAVQISIYIVRPNGTSVVGSVATTGTVSVVLDQVGTYTLYAYSAQTIMSPSITSFSIQEEYNSVVATTQTLTKAALTGAPTVGTTILKDVPGTDGSSFSEMHTLWTSTPGLIVTPGLTVGNYGSPTYVPSPSVQMPAGTITFSGTVVDPAPPAPSGTTLSDVSIRTYFKPILHQDDVLVNGVKTDITSRPTRGNIIYNVTIRKA